MLRFVIPVVMIFGLCKDRGREARLPAACPVQSLEIDPVPDDAVAKWEGLANFSGWYVVSGCGTEVICNDDHPKDADCRESPTYEVVRDRLSLETGCDGSRISIERKAAWTRGFERAYRLNACGGSYVCTTAPGQTTDCKAALATQAPVPVGPPAPPSMP
ncbi:MAG: hypothetical protein QM723_34360 [Myxococcaceae bacterium]